MEEASNIYLDDTTLDIADRCFFDGLLRNSSITILRLLCSSNTNIVGGVGQEILTAYHANRKLTQLFICRIDLQKGSDLVNTTLRCCT